MNQEIPKPLRNALARQAVGDVHPSPDVLTAFMERALAPLENEAVAHHLAQCAECREIVFLASDAAPEQDELRESELVAAAAASRAVATPVYAAAIRPAAAPANAPRPTWTSRMRWAGSIAAAAVLVAGGLVLQFSRARSGHNAAPITVASNRPAPASPAAQPGAPAPSSPEASAKAPVPQTRAKAAPHRAPAAPAKKISAEPTVARNAASESTLASKANPAPSAARAPSTSGVVGGAVPFVVPAAPTQNSFAGSETAQPLQLKQGAPALFGKSRMGMQAKSAARPQWRIGTDGHLERSMAAGQWVRVLDNQPTIFRAVAAVGSDVWAGGNGGALFHSADGGEHWSEVSLAAESRVETGAIVSIRFDDPQHGVVASDRGTRWATTDGGVAWTMQ